MALSLLMFRINSCACRKSSFPITSSVLLRHSASLGLSLKMSHPTPTGCRNKEGNAEVGKQQHQISWQIRALHTERCPGSAQDPQAAALPLVPPGCLPPLLVPVELILGQKRLQDGSDVNLGAWRLLLLWGREGNPSEGSW